MERKERVYIPLVLDGSQHGSFQNDFAFQRKAYQRTVDILVRFRKDFQSIADNPEALSNISHCRNHACIFLEGARGTGKSFFIHNLENHLVETAALKNGPEKKQAASILSQFLFAPPIDPTLMENDFELISTLIGHLTNLEVVKNALDLHVRDNTHSVESNQLFPHGQPTYNASAPYYAALQSLAQALYNIQQKNRGEDHSGLEIILFQQAGLELEQRFHCFMAELSALLGNKIIVLLLDDIDLMPQLSFRFLDIIRRYFSTPYLVPMITAQRDLMDRMVTKEVTSWLGTAGDESSEQSMLVKDIRKSVFFKLFPLNQRVRLIPIESLIEDETLWVRIINDGQPLPELDLSCATLNSIFGNLIYASIDGRHQGPLNLLALHMESAREYLQILEVFKEQIGLIARGLAIAREVITSDGVLRCDKLKDQLQGPLVEKMIDWLQATWPKGMSQDKVKVNRIKLLCVAILQPNVIFDHGSVFHWLLSSFQDTFYLLDQGLGSIGRIAQARDLVHREMKVIRASSGEYSRGVYFKALEKIQDKRVLQIKEMLDSGENQQKYKLKKELSFLSGDLNHYFMDIENEGKEKGVVLTPQGYIFICRVIKLDAIIGDRQKYTLTSAPLLRFFVQSLDGFDPNFVIDSPNESPFDKPKKLEGVAATFCKDLEKWREENQLAIAGVYGESISLLKKHFTQYANAYLEFYKSPGQTPQISASQVAGVLIAVLAAVLEDMENPIPRMGNPDFQTYSALLERVKNNPKKKIAGPSLTRAVYSHPLYLLCAQLFQDDACSGIKFCAPTNSRFLLENFPDFQFPLKDDPNIRRKNEVKLDSFINQLASFLKAAPDNSELFSTKFHLTNSDSEYYRQLSALAYQDLGLALRQLAKLLNVDPDYYIWKRMRL